MPYIPPEDRLRLATVPSSRDVPQSPGELNFRLTEEIERYRRHHGDSYSVFNQITGALNDAKTEFERRVVAPYEDMKREENGDVYAPPGTYRARSACEPLTGEGGLKPPDWISRTPIASTAPRITICPGAPPVAGLAKR